MMLNIGICRDVTLCEIDEVHRTMEDIFFETYTVDVRSKAVRL
jgi:hypothetical protein